MRHWKIEIEGDRTNLTGLLWEQKVLRNSVHHLELYGRKVVQNVQNKLFGEQFVARTYANLEAGCNAMKCYTNLHWACDLKKIKHQFFHHLPEVQMPRTWFQMLSCLLLSFGKSHVMRHLMSSRLLDMQVLVYQSADIQAIAGRSLVTIPRMLHMPPKWFGIVGKVSVITFKNLSLRSFYIRFISFILSCYMSCALQAFNHSACFWNGQVTILQKGQMVELVSQHRFVLTVCASLPAVPFKSYCMPYIQTSQPYQHKNSIISEHWTSWNTYHSSPVVVIFFIPVEHV